MRRVFSLLLAAVMLLGLCACHVDDNTTTAPSNTNANTNTTAPSGTTAPPVDVDITLKTDGWVNMENFDGQKSAFAFGGYYHCYEMSSQYLAFTDTNNGITVILCSKPGCKHDQEETQNSRQQCDAYLGSAVFLLYAYGDKIYYNSDDDGYGGVDLYCRNADGTGKYKFADLGAEYVTPSSKISITYYLQAENKLYYKIDVEESVRGEGGVVEIQTVKQVLMCLNLDTGKEILIGEFTEEHPHMIAAREDQVLFYTVAKAELADMYDPDGNVNVDKMNAVPVCLKVWDETAKQIDVIFEKTNKEYPGGGFVSGSKYYYKGFALDEEGQEFSSWFACDLATEAVEISELDTYPLNGRFLLYESSVYDTQEKVSLPNDFSSQWLDALDQGDEGFILEKVYWKENTGGWTEADYIEYAYVTYDALADGLQASDCLDFYTKHYGE